MQQTEIRLYTKDISILENFHWIIILQNIELCSINFGTNVLLISVSFNIFFLIDHHCKASDYFEIPAG